MDILLLEQIVDELRHRLAGARVAKIHQPLAETLILRLWTGRENLRLLLAAGGQPRLHLTERDYPNPAVPPRFCQLLRARVTRLDTFTQVPDERIVRFDCSGPQGGCRLYAELFGRQGNLILTDARDTIIDTLSRRRSEEPGRELLPGRPFRLPPPRQRIALREELPEIPDACSRGEELIKWLLAEVTPMSPAQARGIAWHAAQLGSSAEALRLFRQRWLAGTCRPRRVELAGKLELVPCPPEELPGEELPGTLSAWLDATRYAGELREGELGDRKILQRIVARRLKRLDERRARIAADSTARQSHEEHRQRGELLLANLHLARKGATQVTVPDYARQPPGEVTIPLDPLLTPQQNAEALFRRYKKEKRGLEHDERRLAETRAERDWLAELQLALDEAESPAELFEIAAELERAGLYRARDNAPAASRRTQGTPALKRATSPGGLTVLWGRNNRANDHLTTRVAAPHDYWFHAHRLPGAHVVLQRDSDRIAVPEADLEFAAGLAAGYSRGRHEGLVEVVVCQARDVYKVKGAHPGQVNLRRFSTLRVTPVRIDAAGAEE